MVKRLFTLFFIPVLLILISGCPTPNSDLPSNDDTDPITYTVSFDSNGGSSVEPQEVEEGSTITRPSPDPSKTGYLFDACYTEESLSTSWDFENDVVTQDMTLYAGWLEDWQETRTFNAIDARDESTYEVTTTLKAVGEYCLVYVEDAPSTGVNPPDVKAAEAVAAEYDTSIHNLIIDTFGEPADVDENGKTILFLLDILDNYEASGAYISGYFDPTDLFSKDTYPVSNEADMLYLDIYPSEPGSQDFYSTIAHEFQHMINFSQTYLVDQREQDLWINEGLSSGAEYVYSGIVDQNRIDWFNNDTLGSIRLGNNFFVWYGSWEYYDPTSVLDNYATVYLFFQWLRIHAGNGTGIYGEILASDERDFQAVTGAAADRIDAGFADWSALLESWYLANILDRDDGLNGYADQIDVDETLFQGDANTVWNFSPGEGIISAISGSGSYTPPDGSGDKIRYLGINLTNGDLDRSAPYEGDVSLVFNFNSDNLANDETGYIASVQSAEPPVGTRAIQAAEIPSSWRIDLHIGPDGRLSELSRNLAGLKHRPDFVDPPGSKAKKKE